MDFRINAKSLTWFHIIYDILLSLLTKFIFFPDPSLLTRSENDQSLFVGDNVHITGSKFRSMFYTEIKAFWVKDSHLHSEAKFSYFWDVEGRFILTVDDLYIDKAVIADSGKYSCLLNVTTYNGSIAITDTQQTNTTSISIESKLSWVT